jgi:hypothetical protein
MADVYARRGSDRVRFELEDGDSIIARVGMGQRWPTDFTVICFWKGGVVPGWFASRKAAAQAAHRAWISAGYPKVSPPP